MNPTVEVFLPVFNEEASLLTSVPRVLNAAGKLPYDTRVTILDNASIDATEGVARELTSRYENLRYLRLPRKGRGYALSEAWTGSEADVVAYMDIDLSTDLAHLPELIERVVGGADLAVGSRLTANSRVYNRTFKREVLSRGYNTLLRTCLASPVKDAQCGFKAMRKNSFLRLRDQIQDTQWFFDTELLLAAKQAGMVVSELPVRWVDDRASSVKVGKTVAQDLRGMARVWWATKPDSLASRLATFTVIGIASTLGYALLYWLLLPQVGAQVANVLALLTMTFVNTGLNRRLTFRRVGRQGLLRHYALGFLALGLTWAFTGTMIAVLALLRPAAAQLTVTLWATGASLLATVLKYSIFSVAFRTQTPEARIHSMNEQKVSA